MTDEATTRGAIQVPIASGSTPSGSKYGAYSELAFVNLAMDNLTYEQYIEVIEAVGPQGVILSSDVGQIFSPTVGDAMREFFSEFQARGVKEDDIVQMSVLNTNRLLFEPMAAEGAAPKDARTRQTAA